MRVDDVPVLIAEQNFEMDQNVLIDIDEHTLILNVQNVR